MRARKTRARQYGFSLFELIVVICIAGFIVYAGLPHFETTLKTAHETAVTLGARALRDGVERAKAIQMLDGLAGPTYDLPRFGDGSLDLSAAGFPSGTSRKPGDRLSAIHCEEIWRALLDANPEEATDADDKNASHAAGHTLGNYRAALDVSGKKTICVYSYVQGGKMRISYDPATGKVWADAKFEGSAFSDQ